MGSKPKAPTPPTPPNQPTTASAIGKNPIGVNRRFDLPAVFTSPQGLDRSRSGRRSLIGGGTNA